MLGPYHQPYKREAVILLENNIKILKTESILKKLAQSNYKRSHTLHCSCIRWLACVWAIEHWYVYLYETHTYRTLCPGIIVVFLSDTHTQVTIRLSSLFKCSEKQSTARVKEAVSNTVLSCKNGVRIPESQRHCCPLHYWIISFSKENL